MSEAPTHRDRVEIPPDAFLRTTGQMWKLVVAGVVLPWPAVLLGWRALQHVGPDQPISEVVVAIGAMLGIAALVVGLLASVRCPRCATRLLGVVLGSPEGLGALTALLKARACPECGHAPRVGPTGHRT